MEYAATLAIDDIPPSIPPNPTRFIDQYRLFLRQQGKSYSTEKSYVYWALYYIRFCNKGYPKTRGAEVVTAFLTYLVTQRYVAVNTQKTALNALACLYNQFLEQPLGELSFHYTKRSPRIPTVFSHQEAKRVIEATDPSVRLITQLFYGSGLRLSEPVRLRVKNVCFDLNFIVVRDGKGNEYLTTFLPKYLVSRLRQQIERVKQQCA